MSRLDFHNLCGMLVGMILMDMNQLTIANLMAESKGKPSMDIGLIRHMVVNTIRTIRMRFREEYGEPVLCYDSRVRAWRKEVYPPYKANRKKEREASDVDWDALWDILRQIKQEIRETFPYKMMEVDSCEGDDLIAILSKNLEGKHLIVSSDHDFFQLHSARVSQWCPRTKQMTVCEDPARELVRHIMRGDSGDGVPNFLSDDTVFIDGRRQKPLFEKKLNEWVELPLNTFCTDEMVRNYERNKTVIDFSRIPKRIEESIMQEYSIPPEGNRGKILAYMMENNMKLMLQHLQEF
jgi:hypothetical protein